MTPHAGEFARLFGELGPDRVASVRRAAAKLGVTVLLKGHVTVLVIAHRTRTLESCDRVLVIDGGRVAAFDVPARVAAKNAFFSQSLAHG